MMWFFAILVVLVLGVIALVAAGRGQPLAEEYDDRRDVLLPPTGRLGSADLRRVRFPLAVRGYRMEEVDALLDRLAAEREAEEAEAAETGAPDASDAEVAAWAAEADADGRPADGTFPPR